MAIIIVVQCVRRCMLRQRIFVLKTKIKSATTAGPPLVIIG